MVNNNDDRILELRKQIEVKKAELGSTLRFVPVTNCLLELNGISYNINVLSESELKLVLVQLNSLKLSAKDLELEGLRISEFDLDEWIGDIQSKLAVIERKSEEQKLKQLEAKLTKLLSDKKKVELEIDEIENFLK